MPIYKVSGFQLYCLEYRDLTNTTEAKIIYQLEFCIHQSCVCVSMRMTHRRQVFPCLKVVPQKAGGWNIDYGLPLGPECAPSVPFDMIAQLD